MNDLSLFWNIVFLWARRLNKCCLSVGPFISNIHSIQLYNTYHSCEYRNTNPDELALRFRVIKLRALLCDVEKGDKIISVERFLWHAHTTKMTTTNQNKNCLQTLKHRLPSISQWMCLKTGHCFNHNCTLI